MSDSEGQDVLSFLECSVCLDFCEGLVYQCKNGHNICGSHLCQLDNCPVCRVPYEEGYIRNLLAEKLIHHQRKKLTMPKDEVKGPPAQNKDVSVKNDQYVPQIQLLLGCKHGGCNFEHILQSVIHEHQKRDCYYRPISCSLKSNAQGICCGEIAFGEYMNHLRTVHSVLVFSGDDSHTRKYFVKPDGKLLRNGSSRLFMMKVYEMQFLISAEIAGDKVFVWVGSHGQRPTGTSYHATIKLLNRDKDSVDEDRELFTWRGLVHDTTRTTRIPTTNDCLVIDKSTVQNSLQFVGARFKYWEVEVSLHRKLSPEAPNNNLHEQNTTLASNAAAILFNDNDEPRRRRRLRPDIESQPVRDAESYSPPLRSQVPSFPRSAPRVFRPPTRGPPQQMTRLTTVSEMASTREPQRITNPRLFEEPVPAGVSGMSEFAQDFYRSHPLMDDTLWMNDDDIDVLGLNGNTNSETAPFVRSRNQNWVNLNPNSSVFQRSPESSPLSTRTYQRGAAETRPFSSFNANVATAPQRQPRTRSSPKPSEENKGCLIQ